VTAQPLPAGITDELELLKRRLADMSADDISNEQTRQMATEIGAIRLQLKRLQLDQQALSKRLNG
jgi:ABC-type phosphate transport system auxiliary subunit